jgi:hypothetical protein
MGSTGIVGEAFESGFDPGQLRSTFGKPWHPGSVRLARERPTFEVARDQSPASRRL